MQRSLYFDRLSGIEFEEYLLRVFEKLGYEGMVTQAAADFGADLLVRKGAETIVVQAKRYADPVGISAVQEVIGAKCYYSADKTMVVATSNFTPSAVKLAKANNVELWDRQRLIYMIVRSFGITVAENIPEPVTTSLPSTHSVPEEPDTLLPKAISVVLEWNQASISLIQRNLQIGYTRAARLIDDMERLGIIGGFDGSRPREVLLTKQEIDKIIPKRFNKKTNILSRWIKKKQRNNKE